MPSQCVWDDEEFLRNDLVLESKFAIRKVVMEHMPAARIFFDYILHLPNAGVADILADLELMAKGNRDSPDRVHRLYGRLQALRRFLPSTIMYDHTRCAKLKSDNLTANTLQSRLWSFSVISIATEVSGSR